MGNKGVVVSCLTADKLSELPNLQIPQVTLVLESHRDAK